LPFEKTSREDRRQGAQWLENAVIFVHNRSKTRKYRAPGWS